MAEGFGRPLTPQHRISSDRRFESGGTSLGTPLPPLIAPNSPSTSHGSPCFVENEILNAERCGDSVSYIKLIWTKANEQELVQKKTFTKWVNAHLALHPSADQMSDLFEDIRDGTRLCYLLEVLSGQKLAVNKGSRLKRVHYISNITTALQFLAGLHVKLVNINPSDIADGKAPIVLGLIWTIILHFQIEANVHLLSDWGITSESIEDTSNTSDNLSATPKTPEASKKVSKLTHTTSTPISAALSTPKEHFRGGAKKQLLAWVTKLLAKNSDLHVKDFTVSWRDGHIFAALIHSARADLINLTEIRNLEIRDRLHRVFSIAEQQLGVPKILEPEDVDVDKPDEKSIMTYVAALSRRLGSAIDESIQQTTAVDALQMKEPTQLEQIGFWIDGYIAVLSCSVHRTQKEITDFYQQLVTLRLELNGRQQLYANMKTLMPEFSDETKAVWRSVNSRWETLMGLLTMKHGTISIDSLPQPLNRIIMWLERSEYLLYQSDESRVSSVESARMLVEEVQKHWESYMRVNSELLSIYTNLCDNLVTGEVLNDIAARLRRFSREIPTISLKLKYHLIKIRFYQYVFDVRKILKDLHVQVGSVSEMEHSVDAIESIAKEKESEIQQLIAELQLAGNLYMNAETESQSKVEIDLSEIESTNLNLMAEVRQFHQLRVSLLLSLRRFDELYEILSTRLQFCLLQDMSQPSHTQELLKLKVDLFKHYEDFILTSVKLESHQDHLAVEQLKCRKAQVLSAWSDLENKVYEPSKNFESDLVKLERRSLKTSTSCSYLIKNQDAPIGEQLEGFKDLLESAEDLLREAEHIEDSLKEQSNKKNWERCTIVAKDLLQVKSRAKERLQQLEENFSQMQKLKCLLEDYTSRMEILREIVESAAIRPTDQLTDIRQKADTLSGPGTLEQMNDIESLLNRLDKLSLKMPSYMEASVELNEMRFQLVQLRQKFANYQQRLVEAETSWMYVYGEIQIGSAAEEMMTNGTEDFDSLELNKKRCELERLTQKLQSYEAELKQMEEVEKIIVKLGLEKPKEDCRALREKLSDMIARITEHKDLLIQEVKKYEAVAHEVTELLRWMSEIREELTSCADASGTPDLVRKRLQVTDAQIQLLTANVDRRDRLVEKLVIEGIKSEDPVAISNHWDSLLEVAKETKLFLLTAISHWDEFETLSAQLRQSVSDTNMILNNLTYNHDGENLAIIEELLRGNIAMSKSVMRLAESLEAIHPQSRSESVQAGIVQLIDEYHLQTDRLNELAANIELVQSSSAVSTMEHVSVSTTVHAKMDNSVEIIPHPKAKIVGDETIMDSLTSSRDAFVDQIDLGSSTPPPETLKTCTSQPSLIHETTMDSPSATFEIVAEQTDLTLAAVIPGIQIGQNIEISPMASLVIDETTETTSSPTNKIIAKQTGHNRLTETSEIEMRQNTKIIPKAVASLVIDQMTETTSSSTSQILTAQTDQNRSTEAPEIEIGQNIDIRLKPAASLVVDETTENTCISPFEIVANQTDFNLSTETPEIEIGQNTEMSSMVAAPLVIEKTTESTSSPTFEIVSNQTDFNLSTETPEIEIGQNTEMSSMVAASLAVDKTTGATSSPSMEILVDQTGFNRSTETPEIKIGQNTKLTPNAAASLVIDQMTETTSSSTNRIVAEQTDFNRSTETPEIEIWQNTEISPMVAASLVIDQATESISSSPFEIVANQTDCNLSTETPKFKIGQNTEISSMVAAPLVIEETTESTSSPTFKIVANQTDHNRSTETYEIEIGRNTEINPKTAASLVIDKTTETISSPSMEIFAHQIGFNRSTETTDIEIGQNSKMTPDAEASLVMDQMTESTPSPTNKIIAEQTGHNRLTEAPEIEIGQNTDIRLKPAASLVVDETTENTCSSPFEIVANQTDFNLSTENPEIEIGQNTEMSSMVAAPLVIEETTESPSSPTFEIVSNQTDFNLSTETPEIEIGQNTEMSSMVAASLVVDKTTGATSSPSMEILVDQTGFNRSTETTDIEIGQNTKMTPNAEASLVIDQMTGTTPSPTNKIVAEQTDQDPSTETPQIKIGQNTEISSMVAAPLVIEETTESTSSPTFEIVANQTDHNRSTEIYEIEIGRNTEINPKAAALLVIDKTTGATSCPSMEILAYQTGFNRSTETTDIEIGQNTKMTPNAAASLVIDQIAETTSSPTNKIVAEQTDQDRSTETPDIEIGQNTEISPMLATPLVIGETTESISSPTFEIVANQIDHNRSTETPEIEIGQKTEISPMVLASHVIDETTERTFSPAVKIVAERTDRCRYAESPGIEIGQNIDISLKAAGSLVVDEMTKRTSSPANKIVANQTDLNRSTETPEIELHSPIDDTFVVTRWDIIEDLIAQRMKEVECLSTEISLKKEFAITTCLFETLASSSLITEIQQRHISIESHKSHIMHRSRELEMKVSDFPPSLYAAEVQDLFMEVLLFVGEWTRGAFMKAEWMEEDENGAKSVLVKEVRVLCDEVSVLSNLSREIENCGGLVSVLNELQANLEQTSECISASLATDKQTEMWADHKQKWMEFAEVFSNIRDAFCQISHDHLDGKDTITATENMKSTVLNADVLLQQCEEYLEDLLSKYSPPLYMEEICDLRNNWVVFNRNFTAFVDKINLEEVISTADLNYLSLERQVQRASDLLLCDVANFANQTDLSSYLDELQACKLSLEATFSSALSSGVSEMKLASARSISESLISKLNDVQLAYETWSDMLTWIKRSQEKLDDLSNQAVMVFESLPTSKESMETLLNCFTEVGRKLEDFSTDLVQMTETLSAASMKIDFASVEVCLSKLENEVSRLRNLASKNSQRLQELMGDFSQLDEDLCHLDNRLSDAQVLLTEFSDTSTSHRNTNLWISRVETEIMQMKSIASLKQVTFDTFTKLQLEAPSLTIFLENRWSSLETRWDSVETHLKQIKERLLADQDAFESTASSLDVQIRSLRDWFASAFEKLESWSFDDPLSSQQLSSFQRHLKNLLIELEQKKISLSALQQSLLMKSVSTQHELSLIQLYQSVEDLSAKIEEHQTRCHELVKRIFEANRLVSQFHRSVLEELEIFEKVNQLRHLDYEDRINQELKMLTAIEISIASKQASYENSIGELHCFVATEKLQRINQTLNRLRLDIMDKRGRLEFIAENWKPFKKRKDFLNNLLRDAKCLVQLTSIDSLTNLESHLKALEEVKATIEGEDIEELREMASSLKSDTEVSDVDNIHGRIEETLVVLRDRLARWKQLADQLREFNNMLTNIEDFVNGKATEWKRLQTIGEDSCQSEVAQIRDILNDYHSHLVVLDRLKINLSSQLTGSGAEDIDEKVRRVKNKFDQLTRDLTLVADCLTKTACSNFEIDKDLHQLQTMLEKTGVSLEEIERSMREKSESTQEWLYKTKFLEYELEKSCDKLNKIENSAITHKFSASQLNRVRLLMLSCSLVKTRVSNCLQFFTSQVHNEWNFVRSCGDWLNRLSNCDTSHSSTEPISLSESLIQNQLESVKNQISELLTAQTEFNRFLLEGGKICMEVGTVAETDANPSTVTLLNLKKQWQSLMMRKRRKRAELQFCLDHLVLVKANNQLLRDVMNNVQEHLVKTPISVSLQQDINEIQILTSEMMRHKHLTALNNLSLNKLRSFVEEKSFVELSNECHHLIDQWNSMAAVLQQKKEKFLTEKGQVDDFHSKLHELSELIKLVRSQMVIGTPNSEKKLAATLHFYYNLIDQLDSGEKWVKESIAHLSQAEPSDRHTDHHKLLAKFERSYQRLDIVKTLVNQRIVLIKSKLVLWENFCREIDMLLAAIQQSSIDINSCRSDPSAVFLTLQEVPRIQGKLNVVIKSGKLLRDVTESKSEKESVELKLTVVQRSWESLKSLRDTTCEKVMNINATVADLKQNVRKLHRWTQYFRLAITGDIIFENCSENEIEKQLRSQDHLEQDFLQHETVMASVLNFCQVLRSDHSVSSTLHTHTCSKWMSLCDEVHLEMSSFPLLLSKRKDYLKETNVMWKDLHSRCTKFLKNLDDMKLDPKSESSLESQLTISKELKKTEKIHSQLLSFKEELDTILQLLTNLSNESRLDKTGNLLLLAKSCSSAFDDRYQHCRAILKRLHLTTELYQNWKKTVKLQMAQLDIAKCQIEKPSDTVEEFGELLALFEQSIEELSLRCLYLIQRSAPDDASRFDWDLMQLHSMVSSLKAELLSRSQPTCESINDLDTKSIGAEIETVDGFTTTSNDNLENFTRLLINLEEIASCPTPEGCYTAARPDLIDQLGEQTDLCERMLEAAELSRAESQNGCVTGISFDQHVEDGRLRLAEVKRVVTKKCERLMTNRKLYEEWADTVRTTHQWLFSTAVPPEYTRHQVAFDVQSIEELHQLIEQHKSFMQNLDSKKGGVQFVKRYTHFVEESTPGQENIYLLSRDALKQWDLVCGNAQIRQQRLQRLLIRSPDFQLSLHNIVEWLDQTELLIRGLDPLDLRERDTTVLGAKYKRFGELENEIQSVLLQLSPLQSAFEIPNDHEHLPCSSDSEIEQISKAVGTAQSLKDFCLLYRKILASKLNGSPPEKIWREIGLPKGTFVLSLSDLYHPDSEQTQSVSESPRRLKYVPVGYDLLPPKSEACESQQHNQVLLGVQPRGRLQLRRILLAALPLQALMVLLLGAASLMPHCDNDYTCFLNNNFASSFYPLLSFPGGIPPPH